VHFDEFDQALDPEVGERHDALVADAMDPDDAIFRFHLHGDVKEPVLIFAKFLGDEVDGFDVRDLVDVHDQAARAGMTDACLCQFHGNSSSSLCAG